MDDDPARGSDGFDRRLRGLGILFPQHGTPKYTSLRHACYSGRLLVRRGGCGMRAEGMLLRDRRLRLLGLLVSLRTLWFADWLCVGVVYHCRLHSTGLVLLLGVEVLVLRLFGGGLMTW